MKKQPFIVSLVFAALFFVLGLVMVLKPDAGTAAAFTDRGDTTQNNKLSQHISRWVMRSIWGRPAGGIIMAGSAVAALWVLRQPRTKV
jgi:ribose/xylose/arabinose/galactoside ABC-type transport system permease subunit